MTQVLFTRAASLDDKYSSQCAEEVAEWNCVSDGKARRSHRSAGRRFRNTDAESVDYH